MESILNPDAAFALNPLWHLDRGETSCRTHTTHHGNLRRDKCHGDRELTPPTLNRLVPPPKFLQRCSIKSDSWKMMMMK
ncbi:hypothetical protein GN956_G13072 [Arapaima gigas]